jgi:hypothetical protein
MLKKKYKNTFREELKRYMEDETKLFIEFGSTDKIGIGKITAIKKDFIVFGDKKDGDYSIPISKINMLSDNEDVIKEKE